MMYNRIRRKTEEFNINALNKYSLKEVEQICSNIKRIIDIQIWKRIILKIPRQ